jgi:hypothetical protein
MNGFDEPDDQRERHYDVFEEVAAFAKFSPMWET